MLAVPAALAAPRVALADEPPREIALIRPATGEQANLCYWADGRVQLQGYVAACKLLRDVRANEAVQMDLRLLDIIWTMQAWLGQHGFTVPVHIHSGYRSLKTNQSTEGAAKNSMHLYGRAADISMPGIPSDYIGRLAQYLQGGGVGFYPGANFTHIDTGRVRTWRHKR